MREGLKNCNNCGVAKPLVEFSTDRSNKDGKCRICKICGSEKSREYLKNNRKRVVETKRRYLEKNRQSIYATHKACRERKKEAYKATEKAIRVRTRLKVIEAYGGRCTCCGESQPEFLCIDHIYGGGNEQRRTGLIATRFYRFLIKNNFPKDTYQLLCHNCNLAKGFYGECPHNRRKEKQAA
jgi:hypothetical protein